jgi:sterol desaturase/sphingolipid hydroxylase (fatty acid hydroxylase superfamily)
MTTTTHTIDATRTDCGAIARYVTYPAVLLANAGLVTWTLATGGSLAGATFIGLLVSIAALIALEWLIPYERSWQPDKKEAFRDLFYFGLNGGIDALGKLGIAVLLVSIGTWSNGLSLAIALPLAVLIGDFAGYWLHRWGHEGWLWKVHGVHHTPDKVNTWNNNTIHFINSAYSGLGKALPLVLLGFSPEVVIIAAYFSSLQSFAVHANIDVDLGWLGYIVMGPAHHRMHHSNIVAEAGNFATVTTVWDIAFGTFVYDGRRGPAQVGVEKPETFPVPLDVVANQLHPFV